VNHLRESQQAALCWQLTYDLVGGELWIPLVARLGKVSQPVLEEATEVLKKVAVPNYRPQRTIDVIEEHWQNTDDEQEVVGVEESALRSAKDDVLEQARIRLGFEHVQADLPEVVALRPTQKRWAQQQNAFRETLMKEARENSLVSKLAQTVPIVRGGATIIADNEPSPFKKFEHEVELPLEPVVDSLAESQHRLYVSEWVQSLLETAGSR
jgi:hypothetical protein